VEFSGGEKEKRLSSSPKSTKKRKIPEAGELGAKEEEGERKFCSFRSILPLTKRGKRGREKEKKRKGGKRVAGSVHCVIACDNGESIPASGPDKDRKEEESGRGGGGLTWKEGGKGRGVHFNYRASIPPFHSRKAST